MSHIDLLKAFDVKEPLPDSLIEFNSEPLFDLDEDISLAIPSYMAWCLEHDHELMGQSKLREPFTLNPLRLDVESIETARRGPEIEWRKSETKNLQH